MQAARVPFYKNTLFPLIVLLVIHTLCWLLFGPAHPHADDTCYVTHAREILDGKYHLTDSPKDHRLGVIIPAACFIKVFGESDLTITLWPFLCSMATVLALYLFLLRYADLTTAMIGTALLVLHTVQITYSAALYPDVIVALFAFLAVKAIFYGRKDASHVFRYSILFSLFFFFGFICKEIIVLILPLVALVFISDIRKRNNSLFWKYISFVFIVSAALFCYICYQFSGHAFAVYDSVEKEHNDVFIHLSGSALLNRLTYGPVVWLYHNPAYLILLIFALPAVISALREKKGFGDLQYFSAVYFLSLLAFYWIGSSSLTRMAPLLLLDRMLMLLLVPLVILSAISLEKVINEPGWRKMILLLSLLLLVALIYAVDVGRNRSFLYLIFASCIFLAGYFNTMQRWIRFGLLLFPFLLFTAWFIYNNNNYSH